MNGHWEIGLSGGVGLPTDVPKDAHSSWWDLAAELRHNWGDPNASHAWFGATLGAGVAIDRLDATWDSKAVTSRTWAPVVVGLALGYNFRLGHHWSVSPELRGIGYGFDDRHSSIVDYSPQTALLLGFSVTGLGP
jgi:hypothetical protein